MKRIVQLAVLLCLFGTLIFGLSGSARATPRSPYSEFTSMTEEDYRYYQFKVTYLGKQRKHTPSLSFWDTSYTSWDLQTFIPYQHDEYRYSNDSVSIWQFAVEPEEMMWFVLEVGADSALIDTSFISNAYASYMIVRDPGAPYEKCFEALLTQDDLWQVLYLLHESLNWSNADGIVKVGKYRRIFWPRD
jgi:hypothetical protein